MTDETTCRSCGGTGEVEVPLHLSGSDESAPETCAACAGTGAGWHGHYGEGDDEQAEDFAAGEGTDADLEDGGDRETEV